MSTLYKDENYCNIVLHVKYELWIQEDLKLGEKNIIEIKIEIENCLLSLIIKSIL